MVHFHQRQKARPDPDILPFTLTPFTAAYAYVYNNPLLYIDPIGETPWGLIIGGADLVWQLYQNGGSFGCVNWADVGLSMLGGGLLNGLGKGIFRAKAREAIWTTRTGKRVNPNSWDATRKWMNKEGVQTLSSGQNRHHWLFERNQGIGKNIPDWIKNQPWNTVPRSSKFNNWMGRSPYRALIGAPSWVPEVLTGTGMAVMGGDGENCGC